MTTNMTTRKNEASALWGDTWNRDHTREKERRATSTEMLGEALLGVQDKEDEIWEEAPEFIGDCEDENALVFTHALKYNSQTEGPWEAELEEKELIDSQCWHPDQELKKSGVTIVEQCDGDGNIIGLNWVEKLVSVRAGSRMDDLARYLFPHLDPDLAQRRCNLYRPLYYKAKDVRWCEGTIHKTYRNCLSKPDFDWQPEDEAGAETLAGMTPEERAAALSAMSTTGRAAVLAAMSYRDEAAALAAMSDEERAAAEALKNVAWASEKTGNEKTGKSGTTYQRALECYMPEFFAMEQLYSVAMWFSAVLLVLMLPLVFDGIGNDNAAEYFHDQHVEMSTHSHWLWRTSWINADGRYGYAEWRDGYAMFVLTCRMLMMGLVLAWACFRHSQYDVMIDHPIGLQDFTVEVSVCSSSHVVLRLAGYATVSNKKHQSVAARKQRSCLQ